MSSLGEAYEAAGQLEKAQAAWARSLALYEKLLGPDHRDIAGVLLLIGRPRRLDGEFDESLAALRRAARIYEHVDGKAAESTRGVQAEIERAQRRDASAPH
jgi:hypothetical protein